MNKIKELWDYWMLSLFIRFGMRWWNSVDIKTNKEDKVVSMRFFTK